MTVPPFRSHSPWRSAVALLALAMLLLVAMHGHAPPEPECGSEGVGLHCGVCDAFLGGATPGPAPQVAPPQRLRAAVAAVPASPVLAERRERGGSRAPPAAA